MKYNLTIYLILFSLLISLTGHAQYRHLAKEDLQNQIALEKLSRAITYKTISAIENKNSNAEEFLGLHDYFTKAFPLVHQNLDRLVINNYSLLYTWHGRSKEAAPVLISAHMDVVPVEKASALNWTNEPFEGLMQDGFVWGRGTLDDKYRVIAILEAIERLLEEGFVPEQTVYLAFGHDEEVGGQQGAAKIAEYLMRQNVQLAAIFDEGLAVAEEVLPEIKRPLAFVGIASKGNLNVKLTVNGEGGHSSVPPSESTIGILSKAISNIESNPFEAQLTPTTRQTLEILTKETGGKHAFAVKHLSLFRKKIIKFLSQDPATDALIRTKVTPTILEAGEKYNVMPRVATAVLNVRILNGEDSTSVMRFLEERVNDKHVKLKAFGHYIPPSPVTPTNSTEFALLEEAIKFTFPEALVVPALFPGATDSQHYSALSQNIFRFAPQVVNREKAKLIHNVNERISEDVFSKCILFYSNLLRLYCSPESDLLTSKPLETASNSKR